MALVNNPLFARHFARFGGRNEERGNRELRKEMLAGLAGRVMEVGPGNGLNFPHYPLSVQEVVAVEPEPYLRSRDILFAGYQQAADLVWPRLMGGCHVQRQTRAAIDEVFTSRRAVASDSRRTPSCGRWRRRVDVITALPKTRSGKILRKTMRGIADGRDEPAPSTIEDPAVLNTLRAVLTDPG
jgi:hypothetical protein